MKRNCSWIVPLGLALGSQGAYAGLPPVRFLEAQASSADICGRGTPDEYATTYTQLAQEYRKLGDHVHEASALRKVLAVDSDRWDLQLRLAALERDQDPERAVSRLRYVIERDPETTQVTQAQHLLADRRLTEASARVPQREHHGDQKLYVVSLGEVDPVVARAVTGEIAKAYGIACELVAEPIEIDRKLTTSLRGREIDHYMLQAALEMGPFAYREALKARGLDAFGALSADDKEVFVHEYLSKKADGERLWQSLSHTEAPQLDATALIGQISSSQAARLAEPACLGILALSPQDIYSGHSRYVLGTATPTVGVVNVSRLMKLDEPRHVVYGRIAKQALSTAGFIVPLGTCNDAKCVRFAAQSSDELDARSTTLCGDCAGRLGQTWKRRTATMVTASH